MTAPEHNLVPRLRQGDPEAFQALIDTYSRLLFRVAWRITSNATDAEDVVQETFLRAYRNLASFDERASFSTWIQRIAVNYALDLVRRRKFTVDPGDNPPDPADAAPLPDRLVLNSQLKDRLDLGMKTLTAQERTAFVLRHFEGHSIGEISESLSIGENAAKHSVFRAIQKLRRFLAPAMEGAL